MKVKTLLKVLNGVEYSIVAESGWTKEDGYISEWDYKNKNYESQYLDSEVVDVKTVETSGRLYITVK